MNTLGLDIGGANLKAAHSNGAAWSLPFELWRQPDALADQLHQLTAGAPPFEQVAITMTAELCDCFQTKREGVHAVLDATLAWLSESRIELLIPPLVWSTRGAFVSVDDAKANPMEVAAANWHAQATWLAQLAPRGTSLMIDMGSTTTDIVLLRDGEVVARGLDRYAAVGDGRVGLPRRHAHAGDGAWPNGDVGRDHLPTHV